MDILLINDSENAEELSLVLGFDLDIRDCNIKARFPVFEYISYSLKNYDYKHVVINCQNRQKGFEISHTLALGFPKQSIMLIDENQAQHYHYPKNFRIFKTFEEAGQYIKENMPTPK